uniref:Uncharacterized protein n=1 Tax=Lygus hesperus TaxID=30085 RepID=A0A0K8SLB3_LYGHE
MLIPHVTVVLTVSALLNTAFCRIISRHLSPVDKKILIEEMERSGAPAIDRFIDGSVEVEKNKGATYHFDYKNNETGKECHGFFKKFRKGNSNKIRSQRRWKCKEGSIEASNSEE